MSDEVNGQITAAISQTNVTVLGSAPAQAMGTLYQTLGNAMALATINAVQAQQQTNMLFQAATARSVRLLLED